MKNINIGHNSADGISPVAMETSTEQEKIPNTNRSSFAPKILMFQWDTKEKQFKCPICYMSVSNGEDFKGHMKKHAKVFEDKKLYQCNVCQRAFREKEDIKQHELCHSKLRFFRCKYCTKKFTDKESRNCHMVTHTDLKHCPHCPKKFASEKKLEEHKDVHNIDIDDKDKTNKCDICDKICKSRESLKLHLYHVHQKKKDPGVKQKCVECKSEFKSVYALRDHVKHVHMRSQYAVICDICGASLSRVSSLGKHKRMHERLNKNPVPVEITHKFKCTQCNQYFTRMASLELHKRRKHSKPIAESGTELCECSLPMSAKLYKNKCQTCFKTVRHHGEHSYSKNNLDPSVQENARSSESKIVDHQYCKPQDEDNISEDLISASNTEQIGLEMNKELLSNYTVFYVNTAAKKALFEHQYSTEQNNNINEPYILFASAVSAEETRLNTVNGSHSMDAENDTNNKPSSVSKSTRTKKDTNNDTKLKVSFSQSVGEDNGTSLEMDCWNIENNSDVEDSSKNSSSPSTPNQVKTSTTNQVDRKGNNDQVNGLECKVCFKTFSKSFLLNRHRLRHESIKIQTYKCNRCGNLFTHMHELAYHTRTVHLTELECFLCHICGKLIMRGNSISRHMKIHENVRQYVCNICSFAFTQRHHLKNHMAIHTKALPFKCELCPAKFRHGRSLLEHNKRHHRNHQCQYCKTVIIKKEFHMKDPDGCLSKCKLCEKWVPEFWMPKHLQMHGSFPSLDTEKNNSVVLVDRSTCTTPSLNFVDNSNAVSSVKSVVHVDHQYFETVLSENPAPGISNVNSEPVMSTKKSEVLSDGKSEAVTVISSRNTELVTSGGNSEPVMSSGKAEPMLLDGNSDAVMSSVKSEPVISGGNSEPVMSILIAKPVRSSANSEPVMPTWKSEPILSSWNPEPVLSTGKTELVLSNVNSKAVMSSVNSDPVLSTCKSEPVLSNVNSEAVMSSDNSEAAISGGNSEPVKSTVKSEPVLSSGNSEPVMSTGQSEPVLSGGNTEPECQVGTLDQ